MQSDRKVESHFSILVPAYNVERFICATVGAVLSQTSSNLELIVIDDGTLEMGFQHLVRE